MFLPTRNGRFIPLRRLGCRSLDAPAHPAQHPPDMARMQANATLAVDQFGHARQRPEVVEETVGLGTLQQRLLQLLPMARAEFGAAPQSPPLPGGTTDCFTLLFPAHRCRATDLTTSSHFRLGNPSP